MTLDRRELMKGLGLLGGAMALPGVAPAFAAGDEGDLEGAFRHAFEGVFNAQAQLDFLAPSGLVVAHDVPFPMARDAWADHLAFHAAQWSQLETRLFDVQVRRHGPGGVVAARFFDRGKPVDSGFRLRSGFLTATCCQMDGVWRALSVHTSSIRSQVLQASPG